MQLLLDHGAVAKPAPGKLGRAIIANDVAAVESLLQQGAEAEDCTGLTCASPLTWAAMNGYIEIMRLLLEAGADINRENVTRETALIMAVCGRQPEAVAFLIEEGADLSRDRLRRHGNRVGFRGGERPDRYRAASERRSRRAAAPGRRKSLRRGDYRRKSAR